MKPKKGESAQRALAETQLSILNALPAHVALLDGNGVIMVVNEAWRNFASANVLQSQDFFVGQNYIGVCEAAHGECAEESQAVARGIKQVLSGAEQVFALEYPCHSPTEQRWFRLMVTPLNDQPGAGAVVMHVNVTECRQAEEALREREREQRQLAESLARESRRLHESQAVANVGSWETNLATMEVTWTEETYRIFEVTPGEFHPTHQRFLELVHPDDRAKVEAAFANSAGRPEAFAIEHRICLPNGRLKFVEERWRTFKDATGQPTRAVGTCQDITERVQAEETRRKAEELNSAIVAAALDAIITIDHQSRILEFNPSAEVLFGWPKAAVLGRDLSEVIIPERLRDAHRRGMARFLATGEKRALGSRLELPAIRADGEEIVIELNATQLGHSTPPQFTAFLRDITRSKQAGDILRTSESRFRALFDQAAVGMCLVSTEGEFLRVNQRFCEIVGYSAEDLLTRTCIETTHPDDRAREAEITTRMLAGELRSDSWEKRYVRQDGRVIWCNLTLALIPGQAGEAQQFVGVVEDITERRQAAAERDRMFDLSVDMLSVGSFEGRLEQVNSAWTRCLGWSAEELTSQPWLHFVHPDDQEATLAAGAALVGGERLQEFENRYHCKDGTYRWLSWNSHPLPETRQIFGVCRDVTERKHAEETLRQNQTMVRIAGSAAKLGGWSIDLPDFKLTWSDETAILHDLPPGRTPSLEEAIEFYPPEYRDRVAEHVRLLATDGIPLDFEHELITARQRRIWVRAIGEAVRDDAGRIVRLYGAFQDITDRKVADLALMASNRALQLLTRCNEALIRSESEAHLLREVCRIAVDIGGFAMAWVGYAQDNMEKTIEPQVSAGKEDGYLADLQVSWAEDHPHGRAPAGHVIRSGEPVVIPDLSKEPSFAPWLATAHAHGYYGVIVLPLKNKLRTFGVLVLYAAEVRTRYADELKLLREFADDLAFGIGNLRSQQERQRMEAAVMKVATSVSVGVSQDFFTDLAVSVSEALDAQGAFVARLLPGEPAMARTIAAVVDGNVVENFEYALRGTPCEHLADSADCIVPDNVAGHFPHSPTLARLGAQAYVGRRLVNAADQTVGLMFVLFREPLQDSGFTISTLQIFATRAAGELERLEADSRIRAQAALLDKATDAILVRDLEHHVVFWSRGAESVYGWSSADALGRPTPELLSPQAVPFRAAMAALMDKGEWTGELEKQNRAGGIITASCRWTLMRNEGGAPESILCIETDITERKKLEAQFLRAQRMESVGTLASGIAHDMNNILAPILMSVELLKEDTKDEATLDILTTLESSSQRAADLVRQLLSFARGLDGQQVAVNLSHLITELHKVMKEVFPKDVEFDVSARRDLWRIVGDPSQLHQVFLNLCVNARDAMPHGGKLAIHIENVVVDEIYAALHPESKTGAYVVVRVSDTGTGIPPAVLDKIFEPFFTTKELGRGTGLGLSTVLGIIKKHGGFVNVYSEVHKGTEFRVYLPAQTSATRPEGLSVTQSGIPSGNGELILVVDDEKGIREIAVKILVRDGYRVLEAANGADAMALYGQHQNEIALVLTDVSMPIMDGVALIGGLRSLNPQVRVLVSSGLSINAGLAKLMESGVHHFMPKPYTADKLLGMIHKALHS